MARKNTKIDIRYAIIAVLLAAILAVVSTLAIVVVADFMNREGGDETNNSSVNSSVPVDNTDASSTESEDTPSIFVTPTGVELDTKFSRLLLINGSHPLPDDYDTNVRDYLVEIDDQYRNNDYVTQIHKDIYPYITAMVAAAQADGVDLQVWSPFRSYSIQNDLFQRQVERAGGDEEKAATVVARPGTSEHNTGLCADFNMADDAFEQTDMFTWMCENAEDYGFILRYPKDKQPITGVIYESWHWRFVGIDVAKEINSLGMTLEEYVEYKNLDPAMDMYTDDSYSTTSSKEQTTD